MLPHLTNRFYTHEIPFKAAKDIYMNNTLEDSNLCVIALKITLPTVKRNESVEIFHKVTSRSTQCYFIEIP